MRWLIVHDGTPRSEKAAAYAAALLRPDEDEVLLLVTGDAPADSVPALGRVRELLDGQNVRELVRPEGLTESIELVAETEQIDVVVYGSRGRRGWRKLLLGSVASYLEHHLDCSLLVVRGETRPIRKILVATSLDPGHMEAVRLGGAIARRTSAAVTILHVMSQLAIGADASELPLEVNAEEAISHHTREGDQLADRLALLGGFGAEVKARIRHGLVLDEVVAELREGGYDLLVVGGHRIPADLPFGNLLAEDMAEEILMYTEASVLIA